MAPGLDEDIKAAHDRALAAHGHITPAGVAVTEREKYERVWNMPGYRRHSPAELVIPTVWDRWVAEHPATPSTAQMTVTDWGCGTGRAAMWMKGAGALVVGVDHAANCLDPGVDIPLHVGCLWEIKVVDCPLVARFALCVDVMEHIPAQFVPKVLQTICDLTTRAGYFQIAHGEDVGVWGAPLHLTLWDREKWAAVLSECGWGIVDTVPIGAYATGYHVRPLHAEDTSNGGNPGS